MITVEFFHININMTAFSRINKELKTLEDRTFEVEFSGSKYFIFTDGIMFICREDYPFREPIVEATGDFVDSEEMTFGSSTNHWMRRKVTITEHWSPKLNIKSLIEMVERHRL